MAPAALVVLEPGAKWPACAAEYRAGKDVAIIVEQDGEASSTVVDRLRRHERAFSRSSHCMKTGLFVLSEQAPSETVAARLEVCRGMVRLLCSGGAEFCIVAPTEGGGGALSELVDTLLSDVRMKRLTFRVVAPSAGSGVHSPSVRDARGKFDEVQFQSVSA